MIKQNTIITFPGQFYIHRLFSKPLQGLIVSDEANNWINKYTERDDLQIVFLHPELKRLDLTTLNKPNSWEAKKGDEVWSSWPK